MKLQRNYTSGSSQYFNIEKKKGRLIMLNIVGNVLLILALIATLKEYKKLQRGNDEVLGLVEDVKKVKKEIENKCDRLMMKTVRLCYTTDKIIKKYDIKQAELNKMSSIFNKSKKIRVKKKAAKRLIKGE